MGMASNWVPCARQTSSSAGRGGLWLSSGESWWRGVAQWGGGGRFSREEESWGVRGRLKMLQEASRIRGSLGSVWELGTQPGVGGSWEGYLGSHVLVIFQEDVEVVVPA